MQLIDYIHSVTAREFARQTGLSKRTAHAYTSRQRVPSPKTAMLIERATGGKVTMRECYPAEAKANRAR